MWLDSQYLQLRMTGMIRYRTKTYFNTTLNQLGKIQQSQRKPLTSSYLLCSVCQQLPDVTYQQYFSSKQALTAPSIHQCIHPSIHQFIHSYIHPTTHPSICHLPLQSSICLCIYPTIHPSQQQSKACVG